ncbi:MAG: tetratricopeptide repeat protein [Candidatus Sungiibacteriota bacterium]
MSKHTVMKHWHLWVSVTALLLFGFLLSQDFLARIVWQKYGRPDVALWLVRQDADFALLLGNYYFGATIGKSEYDLEKAERAYKRAIAAKPGILWGHYQLARIYFMKGDYAGALSEIALELEANPENLRSLYVRGLIYGYRNYPGDLEKAEEDFRRFTFWAPKEWAGYNDLAWILFKQKKYQEAKEAIQTALREVPDANGNPWLWNALGVAELNLREYKNAKISFEKARNLAKNLTARDWRLAYPGNNPADAESGLSAFRKAIEENLKRSQTGVDNAR